MKVKTLSRDADQYRRSTKHDIHKMQVNPSPELHPFEAPREYKRALNAVKLERVFAKPFMGALDGHRDGIYCIAKNPQRLNQILSGACDGELRAWNLASKRCLYNAVHHKGYVRGICVTPLGEQFITVGDDKTIRVAKMDQTDERAEGAAEVEEPRTILSKEFFTGISHHQRQDMFATSGSSVALWSLARSEAIKTFSWGIDTFQSVHFNPIEVNLLAATADDRSTVLYDVRAATPVRKIVMKLKTNCLCWNPMEAFNFTAASEDHNLYTFDTRNLKSARTIHKDHVSAVLSVDYSPTGKHFVSGAYDRSLRIFEVDGGHSKEIYHTRRMQRIFCVSWSLDSKFILSGSDETNIRLWKSNASERLGTKAARQTAVQNYNEKLKEKFKHHPEIKRIVRHRHVPKDIYSAKKEKQAMEQSRKRKQDNRRRHSKPGAVPFKKARQDPVLEEDE